MRQYDKSFVEWEKITKTTNRWYAGYSNYRIKKFADKLKQTVSILTGIPVEDLEKQEVKDKVLGKEWWYVIIDNKKLTKNVTDLSKYNENAIIKPTVRQILQTCGTEAMRNIIHPDIWINALFVDYKWKNEDILNTPYTSNKQNKALAALKGDMPNWIITDVRFPNELQAIKDRGGITIRVNRRKALSPLIYNKDKTESYQFVEINFNEHPSEIALDNTEFDYVINNNGSIEELIEKVKEILIKEKIT